MISLSPAGHTVEFCKYYIKLISLKKSRIQNNLFNICREIIIEIRFITILWNLHLSGDIDIFDTLTWRTFAARIKTAVTKKFQLENTFGSVILFFDLDPNCVSRRSPNAKAIIAQKYDRQRKTRNEYDCNIKQGPITFIF